MMQGDFDNNMFDISGKWVADFEMSHPLYGGASGGGSIPSYSYNYGDGEYYNNYGERVSWAQVNQNYVSHNYANDVKWGYFAGTRPDPYQFLTLVLNNGTRLQYDLTLNYGDNNQSTSTTARSGNNANFVADITGRICAGAIEFFMSAFMGGGEVGLIRSTFTKAATTATNVVYQGIDASNIVRYIGITERDAAIRFAEHAASLGTGKENLIYRAIYGAEGLTRIDARIWEQNLINQYGLGKNGGLLLNKINSIAPKYWWLYNIHP